MGTTRVQPEKPTPSSDDGEAAADLKTTVPESVGGAARWIWPFELEEQIGAGGMGVVYRARYVKNDRRVALKLLPADIAGNATIAARFERELDILKDLKHPHIVHCFGGTSEGAQRYYAMELVEGGTVESAIKERGFLPWEKVVEYGIQVCAALAHAHAHGIIHRDIKPGNLLLTKTGKLKLGDFGLALIESGHKLTADGKTLGTLPYMAPEQIRGTPPVSSKTDLYALGCVLFEMLTGRPPFMASVAGEILHQHLHNPPPRVTSVALDCPPALDALISDLLLKDPALRPEDADAVAERLKHVGESLVMVASMRSLDEIGNAPTRSVAVDYSDHPTPLSGTKSVARKAAPPWLLLVPLTAWITWGLAAWHFGGADATASKLWLQALHDPQIPVRAAAARALGDLPQPAHVALLIRVMDEEPNATVRLEAAKSLERLGSLAKSAVPTLVKSVRNESDALVHSAAKQAMETLRAAPSARGSSPLPILFGLFLLAACGVAAWFWRKQQTPVG